MARTRNSLNDKKDPKAAIFEAACRVIRDKGFHQARITDISKQAGISYGLVYHYFGSKADLFEAVSKEWWSGLYSMLEEVLRSPAGVQEKLQAVVDYFLDQYETRSDLLYVFITEISRSTANLTPERLDCFRVLFDKTEAIMQEGQDEGVLRNDVRARYLTYIFLGALEGFVSTLVLENQPLRTATQKKRISGGLLNVFFDGARKRTPDAGGPSLAR